jgi:mannose-6-phosphate isomerase-like protein (cupin superfamily)
MTEQQIPGKKNFKEISHCLRIAVMQGEYRWHYHSNTDELFAVLEGELKIEIKDHDPVNLKPGEFIKIPSKTIHKTSAANRVNRQKSCRLDHPRTTPFSVILIIPS